MRLNKKKKGNFVGPVSCFALLGLITLGVACPEFDSNASAMFVPEVVRCSENAVDDTITTVGDTGDPDAPTQTLAVAPEDIEEYNRTCTAYGRNVDGSVTYLPADTAFGFTVQSAAEGAEDSGQYEFGFEVYKGPGNTTKTDQFDITFDVKEFIQITTANDPMSVDMTAIPSAAGTTASEATNFTVASNNSKGFEVLVYAADDNDVNLTSNTEANTAKITPITSDGLALNDFGKNTWGYNVVEATANVDSYKPITTQASASAVYTYESATAGKALKLACGTKVDTTLPADTYQTEVVISAVAPFNARMISE